MIKARLRMNHKLSTIRLLLVDDHPVVRLGLRTLLERSPRIHVVGEASTAAGAMELTTRVKPNLVLLDVQLPDGSGFDVCRRIQSLPGDIRVLILTSFADEETVLQSISSGADGFLLKDIKGEQLIQSVEQIADGELILDPAVTRVVMGCVNTACAGDSKNKLDVLNPQERRVLALVAEGKTNKEIGLELELNDNAVRTCFTNLMDKLRLTRRSQAAAFFVEHDRRKNL